MFISSYYLALWRQEREKGNNMDVLTQEEQKMIQEFTLFNDLYMSKFFEDFNEGVELILRLILDREDLVVLEVKVQDCIINFLHHSTCLDVLAVDASGKKYNIEFQVGSFSNLPKRSRYYGGEIDHGMLEKERNMNLWKKYMSYSFATGM